MSNDKVSTIKEPADTQLEDYKKSVKVIYNYCTNLLYIYENILKNDEKLLSCKYYYIILIMFISTFKFENIYWI